MEVCLSGRKGLPAKQLAGVIWSIGSNPIASADSHKSVHRFMNRRSLMSLSLRGNRTFHFLSAWSEKTLEALVRVVHIYILGYLSHPVEGERPH